MDKSFAHVRYIKTDSALPKLLNRLRQSTQGYSIRRLSGTIPVIRNRQVPIEVSVLVLGYRRQGTIHYRLPPQPPLSVGTRLHVALFINQLHFDAVLVEVVRVSEGSLGLQFVNPGEEFQRRIDALISEIAEKSE